MLTLEERVDTLEHKVDTLEQHALIVNTDTLSYLARGFNEVKGAVLQLQHEFNEFAARTEERLDAMDKRFDAMDKRFDAMDGQFAEVKDLLRHLVDRIGDAAPLN